MLKRYCALLLVLVASILLSACLSTDLSPIGSKGSFTPEQDERQLWSALRQAEEKVLPARAVYEDAALEKYLTDIVRRVTPPSYIAAGGQPIQVKVRKDPRLNAGAMAHGLIIVHTGLIARAETEGQLAGVLAHEVAHITHRHQIRKRRELQNQQTAVDIAAFIGTLALVAAAADQSSRGNYGRADAIAGLGQPALALGLNLTHAAMVSGYSRDMEREADDEAIKTMAAAGYSPHELARMFRHMLAESRNRGSFETFFWGSHPRISERIETVEKAAARYPTREQTDKANFERQTTRVRLTNALYDAQLGRWQLANQQTARVLAGMPDSRRASFHHLSQAHLYTAASLGARSRGNHEGAEQAMTLAVARFKQVTSTPGTADYAMGYRGLGDLYFAHHSHKSTDCEAKAAYAKYLELQPAVRDVGSIKAKVSQLHC